MASNHWSFGIGLQSAFLSSNVITAETYTRKEECYEITFYPRRSTSHGYINVKPIVNEDYQEPYGTCFTTFIPFEKKNYIKTVLKHGMELTHLKRDMIR